MAIRDGLMIQWLRDPDATPGALQVVESLGLALSIAAPRALSRPRHRA
jgi:hypothetical protein